MKDWGGVAITGGAENPLFSSISIDFVGNAVGNWFF
jgi:hypothetical protein